MSDSPTFKVRLPSPSELSKREPKDFMDAIEFGMISSSQLGRADDYHLFAGLVDNELMLGQNEEFDRLSKMLETTTYFYLTYKHLGKEYDEKEIHALIKDAENIEFELYYAIYKLLEDKSYLESAYNQVQAKAKNLEPDVAAKFLSYPIPKAIVKEWEKVLQ